jgi:hypothetical protein
MGALIGAAPRTRREPSGLCVAEMEKRRGNDGKQEEHFVVRHLERLPAGTSFPQMAARYGEVANALHTITQEQPEIFVDATGFGAELVDLVKKSGDYRYVNTVYFTHGDRRTEEGYDVRLGKGCLVCRVQLLLQMDRLHLPRSEEAETLADELLNYEVKVEPDANDRYGAFKVGTHDELVTALGLAVQRPPVGKIEHAWLRDLAGAPFCR